jgi:hypothetical protein
VATFSLAERRSFVKCLAALCGLLSLEIQLEHGTLACQLAVQEVLAVMAHGFASDQLAAYAQPAVNHRKHVTGFVNIRLCLLKQTDSLVFGA